MLDEESKRPTRNKFQRHANTLLWKSYLQRQRRWRLLVTETIFAGIMFILAVMEARPVFLTPLQDTPEPPLAAKDLLISLRRQTQLGFAPQADPYFSIMFRASQILEASTYVYVSLMVDMMSAFTEDGLNRMLYMNSSGSILKNPVIWVIWKPMVRNVWKFSIRSTERARYENRAQESKVIVPNQHLRTGFLSVQLAVCQAILELTSRQRPNYEISLVAMPVSPLMQETLVRRVISIILICFTLAFIPPIMDTETLVVRESRCGFKRALRLRNVDYSSMYIGWMAYAFLSAVPICLLASIAIIFIFRWVHLIYALLFVSCYYMVMVTLSFIMAMFHNKVLVACVWSTLFTILQTFLATMLLQQQDNTVSQVLLYYTLTLIVPPLGLVHGLNYFALLQTGRGGIENYDYPISYTIVTWLFVLVVYFSLLMLLQRTIGQERAIGGQVSWKSIIFKKAIDVNKLHPITAPKTHDLAKIQEVDELIAKAISFRNVSKKIMNTTVLDDVSFDIYRGEFTMLYAEHIQYKMITTIEDLITGLTYADKGTITVMGSRHKPGRNFMTQSQMMGYCHHSEFLVSELTVEEHLILFIELSLWNESNQYLVEYFQMRSFKLLKDCDLESVKHDRASHLHLYYKAQLCWAIALLLEPRIIIMPNFKDRPDYVAVIKDKIMQYKKYLTIVKLCFTSINLEYADRIFLFDNKVLVSGGTPAYMFCRYGREYRVRMTLRASDSLDDEKVIELIQKAAESGATVRAHLGSLLILRLPADPTSGVAALIKEWSDNRSNYGITSLHISLPDSDEVVRRAINESRAATYEMSRHTVSKEALKRIAEQPKWNKRNTLFQGALNIRSIGWKYFSFYVHYRIYLIITLVAALTSGALIGHSLSSVLREMEKEHTKKILHGKVLTVEALAQKTNLVLRSDNSSNAMSVANAYVMSAPRARRRQIAKIRYTALQSTESLTEYLITRAIDSPQHYVFQYAYGMDVYTQNDTLYVRALYSPLHHDAGAAARSVARVYMALIRHYSKRRGASIEVTDDPLALDMTPWLKEAAEPPLLIEFFLILSICHITFIPSKEHGLIRHMQVHAYSFSPVQYWFTLYFCDLILVWLLVATITAVMLGTLFAMVSVVHFHFGDLLVIPFLLVFYGLGTIPVAYIFSLGPRAALNSMTFVIVNIIFGESTGITNFFYGNARKYLLALMSITPQYNLAVAFVKIKQMFIYNSECVLFKEKNLCAVTTLHKCCSQCGVMQKCFERRFYLSQKDGILDELITIIITTIFYTTILLLWEHKIIQQKWLNLLSKYIWVRELKVEPNTLGMKQEIKDVEAKKAQLHTKNCQKVITFGEYLLADNVFKKIGGVHTVRNIYFGVSKGEALALAGLEQHGRSTLCEILAGYRLQSGGQLWCMSKWALGVNQHQYARQITLSCNKDPLPQWMAVRDALEFIAILRGVPKEHVKNEVKNIIEALEFEEEANTVISYLEPHYKTRLHFAAAVVGAPPIIILDECAAYQKFSVCRAMFFILYQLRKRGHAVLISSSSVESHTPVTNRLAVMVDGYIYDIDQVDNLVERYSNKGYTVVMRMISSGVNVTSMLSKHFKRFHINDTRETLVNVQVLDTQLEWTAMFQKMEQLKADNAQVNSYVICTIPIDYIYNTIIASESGQLPIGQTLFSSWMSRRKMKQPNERVLSKLRRFERKYGITNLKELPWSAIF